MVIEPVGEPLVQLGPCRLGERVVRGVADQQVAEAERVLALEVALVGSDQLLADRELNCDVTGDPAAASAWTGPRWKTSPSTEPRSSTPLSALSSWSSRAARSAFSVAGTTTSPPAPAAIAIISVTKSGLPPAARAIRSRNPGRDGVGEERLDLGLRQRLEPKRDRPLGASLAQLGPREADQEQWRAGREQRDMLDEVEEGLLTPLDVVEQHDERRRGLELLAERPRDLVRRAGGVALPEQRAQRRRGRRVGRQRAELLDHLDHREVADPLPVGETATVHHPRIEPRDQLGSQARLPDPGLTDNRHELAALTLDDAPPGSPQEGKLVRAADEARPVATLRRLPELQQSVRHHLLGLALQLERLQLLDRRRAASQLERLHADQNLARRCCLLQPRRDVDCIPGGECAMTAGHDLARVHAEARLDLELRQRLPHLERGPQRPQRVVLVREGHPERRDHGVTDELLHRAAMPLDDRPHPFEIPREQQLDRLRVACLTKGR